LQEQPSVDDVRPAACVVCEAAARPLGARLVLHGHGLRARQLRGPPLPTQAPTLVVIQARRFRCQRCHAVLVVLPHEAVPRRYYTRTAIALAVTLYGVVGLSHAATRQRVSPLATTGVSAERRWYSLVRWLCAIAERRLFPSLPATADQPRRAAAARAALALGAQAPPSLFSASHEVRAFFGALPIA
jgi:hypothetical protein